MKFAVRVALAFVIALALCLGAGRAWAHHGAGGGHHGGGRAHARSGHFHHHHVHGAFIVGAPLFFPEPYPYYGFSYYYPGYWPPYEYYYGAPPVYVEKFEGTPTPEMKGRIFCPSQGAYYPAVQVCPGGWMRVLG